MKKFVPSLAAFLLLTGTPGCEQSALKTQRAEPVNHLSGSPINNALRNDIPPSTWAVSVDWGLRLDPNTQALYQNMANAVSTFTNVPADRLHYYSALINNVKVTGWAGMVTNVAAIPGGYKVTATVTPMTGTGVTYDTDYSENYFIETNNVVNYLGFSDPLGLGGHMPESVTN